MSKIVDSLLKDFGKPDSVSIIKLRKCKDVEIFLRNKRKSENRKTPNYIFK
jgi:uncharacterized protein YcgL (UPF0745 family)